MRRVLRNGGGCDDQLNAWACRVLVVLHKEYVRSGIKNDRVQDKCKKDMEGVEHPTSWHVGGQYVGHDFVIRGRDFQLLSPLGIAR